MPNGIASAYGGVDRSSARMAQAANRATREALHAKRVDARDFIEMKRAKHAAKASIKALRTAHSMQGARFDRRA